MESDLNKIIEAILFVYGEPISINKLSKISGSTKNKTKEALEELQERLKNNSGLSLIEKNDYFQLVSSKKYTSFIQKLFKNEQKEELSRASLEVLAIIAYEGPTSRAEIEIIRGVNSSFILRRLLLRGLAHKSGDKTPRYELTLEALRSLGLEKQEDLPKWHEIKVEIEKTKEALSN